MARTVRPYLDKQEVSEDSLTPEEIELKRESERATAERIEADNIPLYFRAIHELSHGDRTKWEFFFELPVLEFLNAWSFHRAMRREGISDLERSADKAGFEGFMSRAMIMSIFTR